MLHMVGKEPETDCDHGGLNLNPVSTEQPNVFLIRILPERKPILSGLLSLCPTLIRMDAKISEERVSPYFSTEIGYQPMGIPVVAIRFNRSMTAKEVKAFRTRPMGPRFYPSLFDLFLSAFARSPDFFRGKLVVDIDTVLQRKNGTKVIPYVNGRAADSNQEPGFDLLVEDLELHWPADTWFISLAGPTPRLPQALKSKAPILIGSED